MKSKTQKYFELIKQKEGKGFILPSSTNLNYLHNMKVVDRFNLMRQYDFEERVYLENEAHKSFMDFLGKE